VSNSSALGGALRAAQAAGGSPWRELFDKFCPPERSLAVTPAPSTRPAYEKLAADFAGHLGQI